MISHGNPVGPAVFTVLTSLASIVFIFEAIKSRYSVAAALFASGFYSISASAIYFSRYMWNPNLVPFFFALCLYSLSLVGKEKRWGFPLFAFAISSLAQVQIGLIFFVAIFILMIPLLISIKRDYKTWLLVLLGLTLPWVPTLIYETGHGFPLFQALLKLLESPSGGNFCAHMVTAWNYLSSFFEMSIKLPEIFLILSLVALAVTFIFETNWRDRKELLLPIFLILSVSMTFFATAYYKGILFIHFAEQLLILIPVILGILLGLLSKAKAGIIVALVLIVYAGYFNWFVYQKEIINGPRQYEILNRSCQIIKSFGWVSANINFNGKLNPINIKYVCETDYNVKIGEGKLIVFQTDYKDKFDYQIGQ
jgi:hypothetical protein